MEWAIWILGAPKPEMEQIERLLRLYGQKVKYATVRGSRVHPGNAYKADPVTVNASTVVLVECDLAVTIPEASPLGELSDELIVVGHYRPGDPGFDVAPGDFLKGSSIGQVIQLLAKWEELNPDFRVCPACGSDKILIKEGLLTCNDCVCACPVPELRGKFRPYSINRVPGDLEPVWSIVPIVPPPEPCPSCAPDGACCASATNCEHRSYYGECQGLPTTKSAVTGWAVVTHAGYEAYDELAPDTPATVLVLPEDLVLAAASGHCPGAAYQGKCPGVDPDRLMVWRNKNRALKQGRSPQDVTEDVNAARGYLRSAMTVNLDLDPDIANPDALWVKDMRGGLLDALKRTRGCGTAYSFQDDTVPLVAQYEGQIENGFIDPETGNFSTTVMAVSETLWVDTQTGQPSDGTEKPVNGLVWLPIEGYTPEQVQGPIPELEEAALQERLPYLAGPVTEQGRKKLILGCANPDVVQAFIEVWAPSQGLVDIYGVPDRGFAGGYLPGGENDPS